MVMKVLNRRQARWAELLAGYDFVLTPIPGSKNPADGPSRRPDYVEDVTASSGPLLPSLSLRNLPGHTLETLQSHLGALGLPTDAPLFRLSASLAVFTPESLLYQQFVDALSNDPTPLAQRESMAPYAWRNGLLLHNSFIYVSETLRLEVLRMHHDDCLAGHFGIAKTLELLSRNYWFPKMSRYVKQYVIICDLCSRSKPSRHMKYGELLSLSISSGPWKGLSCDYIVDLSLSNGFDALLVLVDRFTKMLYLIPCNKTTDAPQFARMLLFLLL
jgi:hypothetical protein